MENKQNIVSLQLLTGNDKFPVLQSVLNAQEEIGNKVYSENIKQGFVLIDLGRFVGLESSFRFFKRFFLNGEYVCDIMYSVSKEELSRDLLDFCDDVIKSYKL